MKEILSELKEVSAKCIEVAKLYKQKKIQDIIKNLDDAIFIVAKAFSGSWLGYHANVYYDSFQAPPSGCHFSMEWGFNNPIVGGTVGNWKEYTYDEVDNFIKKKANNPDIKFLDKIYFNAEKQFNPLKDQILTSFAVLSSTQNDTFLEKIEKEFKEIRTFSQQEIIEIYRPSGQLISRDSLAISQGIKTPPHIAIYAMLMSVQSTEKALTNFSKKLDIAYSYLCKKSKIKVEKMDIPKNIFIGHGRSKEWKELKDFLKERLNLQWDEFNRESPAGIPTTERLSKMLKKACFAFIIMTAEDQHSDNKLHARENVIHEVGLFQGRLGFKKAIILLEDGCEEFSNIHGLGQIRFPKGYIETTYEKIRKVLEREGII